MMDNALFLERLFESFRASECGHCHKHMGFLGKRSNGLSFCNVECIKNSELFQTLIGSGSGVSGTGAPKAPEAPVGVTKGPIAPSAPTATTAPMATKVATAQLATTAATAPMPTKVATAQLATTVATAPLAAKAPLAPLATKPPAAAPLAPKFIPTPVATQMATKATTAPVTSTTSATKANTAPVASPMSATKATTAPVASPMLATKATPTQVAAPFKPSAPEAPKVAPAPVVAKPIPQAFVNQESPAAAPKTQGFTIPQAFVPQTAFAAAPTLGSVTLPQASVPQGPRAAAPTNPSFNFGGPGSLPQAVLSPFDVADAPATPQRKVYMINDLVVSPKLGYDGPSGNSKQVRVGFVYDGSTYLIASEEDTTARNALHTLINAMVAQGKLQKLGCNQIPVVGEVLIGDYLQEYYRAVVTDVNEGTRIATIEFVDFGDVAQCSVDDLFIPTDELMKYPLYGATVQLPGVPTGTPVPEQVTAVLDKTAVVVKYQHDRETPIKYKMVGRIYTLAGDDIKYAVEYLNSIPDPAQPQ